MKLRKHLAREPYDIERGLSAIWKTAEGRFFIYSKDPPLCDRRCWVINTNEDLPEDEAGLSFLKSAGLWQTDFPTRRAAAAALELALQGAAL